jgi:TonB family protein
VDTEILSCEMDTISSRTRKSMGLSFLLHCLFLVIFGFIGDGTGGGTRDDFMEITWIETKEIDMDGGIEEVVSPGKADEKSKEESSPEPAGKKAPAGRNRLDEILASNRDNSGGGGLVGAVKLTLRRPSQVNYSPDVKPPGSGSGIKLIRQRSGPEGELRVHIERAKLEPTVAKASVIPLPERYKKSSEAETAGEALLKGPISDRPLLYFNLPEYPDWAKSEGIEVSVGLYFEVEPDGGVSDNILIEETSGFEDFDNSAVKALLSWRFEPASSQLLIKQWGRIKFDYRIKGVPY